MFTWKWMFQYPIRKCQNKLYVFSNFFLYILGHKELLQRMILYGRFIIIEATRRPNLTRGWRSFFFFFFFFDEYFKNLYFSPRNDGKGCQPLEYKSNLVCWIWPEKWLQGYEKISYASSTWDLPLTDKWAPHISGLPTCEKLISCT